MVKNVSLSRRGLAGSKSRALTFHLLFPKLEEEEEEEEEEEGEEKEQEAEEGAGGGGGGGGGE